ncbi:MAG: hypothetical protein K2J16_06470, partial [Clostridia bacterium]|nr:hypothetical protein [Clostridia bacterium]
VRNDNASAYEKDMAEYNKAHGFETLLIDMLGYEDISSTSVKVNLAHGDYSNVPAATIPLLQSEEFAARLKPQG